MAQGDVVAFDQFMADLADADVGHDFGSGNTTVVKIALLKSTITPATTTADPCWGAGGSTDMSTHEVTAAGDYTTGGNTCATPSAVLSGGVLEFDWGDPAPWTSGTDADAKWGFVYNDSTTNKKGICYVDLGSAFDMSTGTLTITFGTPAMTMNQA